MRETTRTILTAVTVAVVMALLMPVGAQAAGQLMTIVDANTNAKAQVEDGKLRVGDGNGPLTVNGTVDTSHREWTPYATGCVINYYHDGAEYETCTMSFPAPPGKILVITNISASFSVPSTQSMAAFGIDTVPGENWGEVYIGYDQSTAGDNGRRTITYAHHTEIAVPAGVSLRAFGRRTENSAQVFGWVRVAGYLTTP